MTVRRPLFFAALALVAGLATSTGVARQPSAPSLLFEAPAGAALAAPPAPDTLEARPMVANLAALDADLLDIPVRPDRSLRAVVRERSLNPDGSESWSGQIADAPFSSATFVRAGTLLQGSIRTLDAAYSIEPLGTTGLHVMRQVQLSALGQELPPLVPAGSPAALDTPPISLDDGSIFDVLVVFTPAARTAAGGTDAAVQARINLGITETNAAYANSGIIPRLRLVGAEAVSYTESGDLGTDLTVLTGASDGVLDAVHARRNALGADLVQLVVGSTAGNACGIAWLMNTLSSGFATNAFSVTAYPCISPNYTFGHELGHNMGSNHAPEDGANNSPLYPYSFGYKNPSNLFRTVMAYNCPADCPRVLYFSNPAVLYNGAPTGTVAQHNNALSINNARTTIANFRQAVSANTAPTITAIGNRTTPEDTATPAIAFTVADAETAAASLVVTASSSNPAVVANTPAALALGGTGGSRTLVVTPQPDASGTTTITVTVSDGTLSAPASFVLTVTSVNDPPVVSAIGAQSTSEDTPLSVGFTISDVDTPLASLVVQATSSNTSLVDVGGIGFGGSGTSRQIVLTPESDQSGLTTIIVSVSDGLATSQRSLALTVTPVNDPPAFVALAPLISTTVNVAAAVAVTVSDIDSTGATLSLGVSSANPALLPAAGISVVPTSATASSRSFLVTLAPAAGEVGTSALTFTAGDGAATTAGGVSFNVTSVATAPDPPTGLSAVATGTSVAFAWTPALTGTAPTSFSLELGTSAGASNLPSHSATWPATGLTLTLPAGTYFARVRAVNGIGASAPSPEATVVVTEPSPIPGPPGNFSATVSGRTVTFTWTAATTGAAATSYRIEAGSAPGLANLAQLSTGTPATSFAVPNVPAGTYWVRVRGSNAAGTGASSQDVAIVMGAVSGCVGLPGPPVLLTPVTSGSNVSLNWNPPAFGGLVNTYVLMAGSAPGLSNLAVIATGNAATSFAASAPSGLYFVRVAAANDCGQGPASNEVSFSIGSARPEAPTGLAAVVGPGGAVSLSWTAPPSGPAPTGYLIEAGTAPGRSDLATQLTGSTVTAFAATAQPGRYYVRVRAVNGAGPGAASSEIVVEVP